MFDCFKGVVQFTPEEDQKWNEFFHDYTGLEFKKHPKGFQFLIHNGIYATYSSDSRSLILRNSIYKFIKGNNIEPLTISDIRIGISKLCESFFIDKSECNIRYLEIGLNIQLDHNPDAFLEQLNFLRPIRGKHMAFLPVANHRNGKAAATIYQASYDEYTVKFYNKGKHENMPGINLLRFEIKFHRMRKLTNLLGQPKSKEVTLLDMRNLAFLKKTENMLEDFWNAIELKDSYDLSNLKPNDATLLFAGQNPLYWKYHDGRSIHTGKEYKRKFKKLLGGLPISDLKTYYNQKFKTALTTLHS